jgi:hypothetical protein
MIALALFFSPAMHAQNVTPVTVELRTLLWTRGRASPISMLSSLMRCAKCGARQVSVRLSLPGSVLVPQAKARR